MHIRNVFRRGKHLCLKFFVGFSLLFSLLIFQKTVFYYEYDDVKNNANDDKSVGVTGYNIKHRLNAIWVGFRKTADDDLEADNDAIPTVGLDTKSAAVHETHPLENSCKYPVLDPDEDSIKRYVKHVRSTQCEHVMSDIIELTDDGILKLDRQVAYEEYGTDVKCVYRSFAGTLKPHITVIGEFGPWTEFKGDGSERIFDDQIEVQCFNSSIPKFVDKKTPVLYKFAFAQVAPRQNVTFTPNSENLLSMDMIVLDSTSLNMMRRHMSGTLKYLLNEMGALHLEGYTKVADNSMVNLLPILAGKRYGNQMEDWPSDYNMDKVLDLDVVPFIWKDFAAKGCATMFNDDPMHFTRGLFHYPWEQVKGFTKKPTDYFYRPWHVYHRRFPVNNASMFCFGNKPYYQLQLNLVEQMINTYKKSCHFSFSFFTDLPHDNPSNLEQMDDTLTDFLKRLRANNALNHTVLIIMGDHGHRIAAIMYTYIGRIEERTPFFSIYFPEWLRRKYPNIGQRLKFNKNRLTSNYDIHKMLKDIIAGKFDGSTSGRDDDHDDNHEKRGISLFREIPAQRTCHDALIPDHHCTCLIRDAKNSPQKMDANLMAASRVVILNFTLSQLASFNSLCQAVTDIEAETLDVLTTNQMIQHGMRNQEKLYYDRLKQRYLIGEIDYIEVKYRLLPTNVEAVIRLQHDKKRKTLFVNVPPLVDTRTVNASCFGSAAVNVPKFCSCSQTSR